MTGTKLTAWDKGLMDGEAWAKENMELAKTRTLDVKGSADYKTAFRIGVAKIRNRMANGQA